MTESFVSTALIFPLELLLPILGILLIRSYSPINSLIYRSFLGSIAALIFALTGAPDVALTEVMVGTLLSSLLYIVTIRSCYSIVVIFDENSPPSTEKKSLKIRLKKKPAMNGLIFLMEQMHVLLPY